MDKNIVDIISQKETQEGLIDSFIQSLKRMFACMKQNENIDVDKLVIAQGESETEISVLKEICEDIHIFNSSFRELHEVKKEDPTITDAKWLDMKMEQEASSLVKELDNRDMTYEEKKLLKKEFIKQMDAHIEQECVMLNKEGKNIISSLLESEGKEETK